MIFRCINLLSLLKAISIFLSFLSKSSDAIIVKIVITILKGKNVDLVDSLHERIHRRSYKRGIVGFSDHGNNKRNNL